MTSPDDLPRLAEQPVDPYGKWVPDPVALGMLWQPADDYDGNPRGPLLPQVHESGTWVPGRGEQMTWTSSVAPVPEADPTPGGEA